jgi:hypothetical protein
MRNYSLGIALSHCRTFLSYSPDKQNWKVFGIQILQVSDRTANITAKEPTLKLPPNYVSLVEMLSGTAPSILVARMNGYGGLEKGYGLDT